MSKLYFYYSAMNAGKSALLIQSAHNYKEQGMNPIVFSGIGNGNTSIDSRTGIKWSERVYPVNTNTNFVKAIAHAETDGKIDCVLVDEAQFLSADQIKQLANVADNLRIPILCYGIRVNCTGELFPGSAALLALADKLIEVKTICKCGRKASMQICTNDVTGEIVRDPRETMDKGQYESLCRKHFFEKYNKE